MISRENDPAWEFSRVRNKETGHCFTWVQRRYGPDSKHCLFCGQQFSSSEDDMEGVCIKRIVKDVTVT